MSKFLFAIKLFTLLLVEGVMAISPADTSAKFSAPSLKSLYVSDYSNGMALALEYFSKDSIDKAIPLFYQSMLSMDKEKHVLKANSYHFQEMFAFSGQYTDRKLTTHEAELTRKLFKQLFNPATEPGSNPFTNLSKERTTSLFEQRINLFISSFDSPKTLTSKINKLLKENPDLLNIRLLESELQFHQGKYNECINSCSAILEIKPDLSYCYNLRGVAYRRLAKHEPAIADFKRAQFLCPDFLLAGINLADVCMDSEKYGDAIKYLKLLLVKAPKLQPIKYSLAKSYYNTDSLDSAMTYIDEYIRAYPEVAKAHDLRGDIYYDRDKYPEAISDYSYAISLAPKNTYYYSNRGAAFYHSDKTDEALADFLKSYELDKEREFTLDKIGDCYLQKKEYNNAIGWYKKALKVKPTYKYSFAGLGNAYTQLKKYGLSIAAYEKAVKLDSTYDNALGNLGWSYYCAGKYSKCVEYSYKALKYNEEAVYAMFNIPLAVLRSGDFQRAGKLYEYFINLCKAKKLEINEGAISDLENLINENVMVEHSKAILKTYFNKG
jgi:tetratricopeptide (TPR) repeat protein